MSAGGAFALRGPRRTGAAVWRGSFDVKDPRADVFRKIGDGSEAGALHFIDCYLKTMEAWADDQKIAGRTHKLTANAIRVAKVLLLRCTDFKDGRCEPCLETIMEKTKFARATVVRALASLREEKFLDWVRRTVKRDDDAGPAVKQTSNAYFFDVTQLASKAQDYLRRLLEKKPAFASATDFKAPPRVGSGALPPYRERMIGKAVAAANGGSPNVDQARRAQLFEQMKDRSPEQLAALHYPDSADDRRAYLEMLDPNADHTASSGSAPQSPHKKRYKE